MNTKDKELYALLEYYRERTMVAADNCLEQIANLTGFKDYTKLRNNPTLIDDVIADALHSKLREHALYSLAETYDHFMLIINDIEVAMFKLSDGKHLDVDAENINVFDIEESIEADQSEEFKEFVDGLRDYE